jgi:energy-coupling factor transport system permease protein
VIAYRRRATPLHAARAGAGAAYCAALATVAVLFDHPAVIAAAGVAALGAGALAGVGRDLLRTLMISLPIAVLAAVVNPLVAHQGLTVIARLGEAPVLGRLDVTLEATVYGALTGLRLIVLVLAGALYTVAVDPDEILRLVRRVSFRSALTATLATRLVPVLARDARRVADAQRCRPGPPPSRVALLRAVAGGALDRAVDVAAALETRGYGAARRAPRGAGRPWSRHDLGFAAASAAIVALGVIGRLTGVASFEAYPVLRAASGPGLVVLIAALVLVAWLPFLARRGIVR